MESIHAIVRKAEDDYLNGTVDLGKYVSWSMHDTIETADAYLNSKHTSGPTDALGREKPFFNIVTAAVNIWYRATDIDRKDIRILPDSSADVAVAFLATVLLHNWMIEGRFAVFLNEWGRTLAKYGSAISKFVEKDGELIASVVPWNRFIADPVDFDALPRIEKFYKTPAQLQNMATPGHPDYAQYDLAQVTALTEALQKRQTLDKQSQGNNSNFAELYEVHGMLPSYLLTGTEPKPDEKVKYVQQMQVVSFVKSDTNGKEWDDFTVYKGKEAKDPYRIDHLIKEDGRTLAIGAVEYLFDAQWMANHTMKQWKDQMDVTSRIVFQTADPAFKGRNVLSNIETGDIFIHAVNAPVERMPNEGHDTNSMQNFMQQWNMLAQNVTSTPDALRGNTMPSGTPYSLAAYAGTQAGSLFELMTENKGLAIEDMLRERVIPFLKKQLDNKDEVVALLDEQGVAEIDAMYVPREAIRQHNDQVKQALLKGELPSPYQKDVAEAQVKQQLAPLGNKRFFKPDELDMKTWKQALDGLEMRVNVEVTNESSDKQAVLTTLSTLLQSVASNPAVLQDPNARLIFNEILRQTSVLSPIQLSTATSAPAPATPPPTASPPVTALSAIASPGNGTA